MLLTMKYPALGIMSSIRLPLKLLLLHTAFHSAQQEARAQQGNGDALWVHGGVWTKKKHTKKTKQKNGEFIKGKASAVHQRVFEFRFGKQDSKSTWPISHDPLSTSNFLVV